MEETPHSFKAVPVGTRACVLAVVGRDEALRIRISGPLRRLAFNVLEFGDAGVLMDRVAAGLVCEVAVVSADPASGNSGPLVRHLWEFTDTSIVVVGAKGDPAAATLGNVADAFVETPVDPERIAMLAAALNSLQRRLHSRARKGEQPAPEWRLAADGWSLRTPEGVAIPLGDAERKVLRALASGSATGAPVPYEELIRALTPHVYDYDPHRLEMLVHRLRKKAALVTPHPLPLRAVRGSGYLCQRLSSDADSSRLALS